MSEIETRYCPNCRTERPITERWRAWQHVHVWGALGIAILLFWPMVFWWLIALLVTFVVGGGERCAVCGYDHLIPIDQRPAEEARH